MLFFAACILLFSCRIVQPQAQPVRLCRQLVLEGQAGQGSEWHASLGRDAAGLPWLIRLVPVGKTQNAPTISGWDLAISPLVDQDYPDALLLASPPYGSLNSREIATTYGMRAQDAVAWSPRHFHFFASSNSFTRARSLYSTLLNPNSVANATARQQASTQLQASAQLLDLSTNPASVATGKFEILDAHLVSGSADPAPFASQWAAVFDRMPHALDSGTGKPTPQGELHSLRFKLTLWLPDSWKASAGGKTTRGKCAE